MFDVASSEVILLGAVALLVIPPKDLPKAMRVAGYWLGKVRGVATQFRSGFDTMVREAELQEMEKRWAEENDRIMREHPPTASQPMTPIAPPPLDDEARGAMGDPAPLIVEPPVVAPAPVSATSESADPATEKKAPS